MILVNCLRTRGMSNDARLACGLSNKSQIKSDPDVPSVT